MAEQKTRSILESIKSKLTKIDKEKPAQSKFSEVHKEFEYQPGKNDNHEIDVDDESSKSINVESISIDISQNDENNLKTPEKKIDLESLSKVESIAVETSNSINPQEDLIKKFSTESYVTESSAGKLQSLEDIEKSIGSYKSNIDSENSSQSSEDFAKKILDQNAGNSVIDPNSQNNSNPENLAKTIANETKNSSLFSSQESQIDAKKLQELSGIEIQSLNASESSSDNNLENKTESDKVEESKNKDIELQKDQIDEKILKDSSDEKTKIPDIQENDLKNKTDSDQKEVKNDENQVQETEKDSEESNEKTEDNSISKEFNNSGRKTYSIEDAERALFGDEFVLNKYGSKKDEAKTENPIDQKSEDENQNKVEDKDEDKDKEIEEKSEPKEGSEAVIDVKKEEENKNAGGLSDKVKAEINLEFEKELKNIGKEILEKKTEISGEVKEESSEKNIATNEAQVDSSKSNQINVSDSEGVTRILSHDQIKRSLIKDDVVMKASHSIKNLIGVVNQVSNFSQDPMLTEIAIQLMEPKIEKWLNENISEIIEKIVKEEISRIVNGDN